MLPAAWSNEHNKLHHYNLGEAADPDQVELNLESNKKVEIVENLTEERMLNTRTTESCHVNDNCSAVHNMLLLPYFFGWEFTS